MADPVDQWARDKIADIGTRLGTLESKVDDLRSFLKWFGGLLVTLMISILGWALLQQYNVNESQKQDLQKQIQLLQAQESSAASAAKAAAATSSGL